MEKECGELVFFYYYSAFLMILLFIAIIAIYILAEKNSKLKRGTKWH